MKRVAINRFGRIGRAALTILMATPDIDVITINELMSPEYAAYLLTYNSIYGKYDRIVSVSNDCLLIHDKRILFLSQQAPSTLPWQKLNTDVMIECAGLFTKRKEAEKHIRAGAKTVILSGPTSSRDIPTVVHGVNTADGKINIFSCGSCTTNNIGTVMEILGRRLGIKKAILNTIYALTASQFLVDSPSKRELRMGRSAVINLAPTSTGAAISITKALPEHRDKFDGVAFRTPVAVGSISDTTFLASRTTTVREINRIFEEEAGTERYKLVLAVSTDPLVSTDIIKSPYAAVVDRPMTRVVNGDLVKIMAWYDNEWVLTNQMIRQMLATFSIAIH